MFFGQKAKRYVAMLGLAVLLSLVFPVASLAEQSVGEKVATLGTKLSTELSTEQTEAILKEEKEKLAELAKTIGTAEAAELMNRLQAALGNTKLETDADYENLVKGIAQELKIQLTDQDLGAFVHLLKRLKEANIDWNKVGEQLTYISDNLEEILNREETKSFIRQILDFLIQLIEMLKELLSS